MLEGAGASREKRLAGVLRTMLVLYDRARALITERGIIGNLERITQIAFTSALRHGTTIQVAERFLLGRGNLAEAGRLAVGVAASGAAVEGANAAPRVRKRRTGRRATRAAIA
jgi:hypothetical protein